MPRSGPRRVRRYREEFKPTAVRLSQQPGIQVQTVAAALAIHPVMRSTWRTDVRDGRLQGRPRWVVPAGPAREIAQLQALETKYAELREAHELPKKRHPVLLRSKRDRLRLHREAERAHYGVTALCRRSAVTPAGFSAWRRRRGPSAHAEQDRRLAAEITRRCAHHRERSGSPRIHHLLLQAGWAVGRRRVARLLRAAGLRAKAVRGYRPTATTRRLYARHPDRLPALALTRPHQVWGGAITYAARGPGLAAISRS